MEIKLVLEEIYEIMCVEGYSSLDNDENREFYEFIDKFVKYRLWVSGGDKISRSCSMDNVENFINELVLFDNMMCDYLGCYRGEFSEEGLERLEELMDEFNVEEELKNIIVEVYKEKFEIEDDDEE